VSHLSFVTHITCFRRPSKCNEQHVSYMWYVYAR